MFNKQRTPTVKEVFIWLNLSEMNIDQTTGKKKKKTVFRNIGPLTALLICGDLVEANILPMPTSKDWGTLIAEVGKGAQAGMEMFGLVEIGCDEDDICNAFISLDLALQRELRDDEKKTMGYNVIMLEHTLCKIKRLASRITMPEILYEL